MGNFEPTPRSYNFVKALEFTLPWECGRDKNGKLRKDGGLNYEDDGLPTKYGIFKRANPDIDVENLTLDQAIELYKDRYWLPYLFQKPIYLNMDVVEIGLAVALFDTGVNVGVPRAWGWFLKVHETKDPAKKLIELRSAHYFNLVSQDRIKYGPKKKGWDARVNDLKKYVDVLRREPAGFAVVPEF